MGGWGGRASYGAAGGLWRAPGRAQGVNPRPPAALATPSPLAAAPPSPRLAGRDGTFEPLAGRRSAGGWQGGGGGTLVTPGDGQPVGPGDESSGGTGAGRRPGRRPSPRPRERPRSGDGASAAGRPGRRFFFIGAEGAEGPSDPQRRRAGARAALGGMLGPAGGRWRWRGLLPGDLRNAVAFARRPAKRGRACRLEGSNTARERSRRPARADSDVAPAPPVADRGRPVCGVRACVHSEHSHPPL